MTLLDLMATPPDRKPLIFEPPEFLDVPLVPNEKEVFNDIVEKEFKGAKDTITMSDEMDSEPKEQAKSLRPSFWKICCNPCLWTIFRKKCPNPREQRERRSGQM